MKLNLFQKEKNFEQEIRDVFDQIIIKNEFIVSDYYEKKGRSECSLSNNILILEFGYAMGETWCKIKRPTDDRMSLGYELWHIFNFLYPNDKTYTIVKENGYWASRYEQLQIYAHMLTHEMAFVLKGDYFWEKEYLEDNRKEEAKMEIFWKIDISHPIKEKFHNNDPTWKEDLDKYIKDNDIVL